MSSPTRSRPHAPSTGPTPSEWWSAQLTRPAFGCSCFSMCTDEDVSFFHMHLPIVRSTLSPWVKYLNAVYRSTSVPLPLDISSLEMFYLHLLPVDACDARAVQPCADHLGQCDGWLLPHANRSAFPFGSRDLLAHSYQMSLLRIVAYEDGSADLHESHDQPNSYARRWLLHAVVAQQNFCDRVAVCDGTHVEVVRIARPEGGGYGCWFYRARGSGVFIDVGATTVVYHTRWEAGSSLGEANCRDAEVNRKVSSLIGGITCRSDSLWARYLAARNLSSVQIIRHLPHRESAHKFGASGKFFQTPLEMMLTNQGCMRDEALVDSCPPADVHVRAGWNAQLHCQCRHDPDVELRSYLTHMPNGPTSSRDVISANFPQQRRPASSRGMPVLTQASLTCNGGAAGSHEHNDARSVAATGFTTPDGSPARVDPAALIANQTVRARLWARKPHVSPKRSRKFCNMDRTTHRTKRESASCAPHYVRTNTTNAASNAAEGRALSAVEVDEASRRDTHELLLVLHGDTFRSRTSRFTDKVGYGAAHKLAMAARAAHPSKEAMAEQAAALSSLRDYVVIPAAQSGWQIGVVAVLDDEEQRLSKFESMLRSLVCHEVTLLQQTKATTQAATLLKVVNASTSIGGYQAWEAMLLMRVDVLFKQTLYLPSPIANGYAILAPFDQADSGAVPSFKQQSGIADQFLWLPRCRVAELSRWLGRNKHKNTLHQLCSPPLQGVVDFFYRGAYHANPEVEWNPYFRIIGRVEALPHGSVAMSPTLAAGANSAYRNVPCPIDPRAAAQAEAMMRNDTETARYLALPHPFDQPHSLALCMALWRQFVLTGNRSVRVALREGVGEVMARERNYCRPVGA